jgi:pSer/pThr/pTyr-binding forkhead associated (FHA) protein
MSAQIMLILRILIVTALYAFLGWSLWMLWYDLSRQGVTDEAVFPSLTLVSSSEKEEFTYQTSGAQILVGRDPSCDLHIDDQMISARHALLSYHHEQWWVEDINSRNGTYLNDILVDEPMVITTSDVLRFGNVEQKVLIGD